MNNFSIEHRDQFGQALRHRCRNPRCKMKLERPVENPREAFCTKGCHSSFYRRRCVICEGEMERRAEHQLVCGKRRCRNALQGRHAPSVSVSPHKNSIKTGFKSGLGADRTWRIVAGPVISACVFHCASLPTDPDTVRRTAAANDWERIRQEIAWSKRAQVHDLSTRATTLAVTPSAPPIPTDLTFPIFCAERRGRRHDRSPASGQSPRHR